MVSVYLSITPTTTTIGLLGEGVDVSISPSSQENWAGGTLNYTVTVTNTGNVEDTYDLEAWDDAGWPIVLPTSLTVRPGENRIATLTIGIPENARPSTRDNVVVTATSQLEPYVWDSASCVAYAGARYLIDVSISPGENSGPPGSGVKYTVTVGNIGMLNDNYNLTLSDNVVPSWSPSLDNVRFDNVAPGENRTATLSVTIPTTASNCTRDNIRVTATSMENSKVSALGTCIAHAVVIRSVEVSISPSDNSGPSGSTLTYTVVVKNTGNVADNYNLTASDNAGWGLLLSPTFLTILPGENRTSTLNVFIPSSAPYGATNRITVWVAGTGVENRAICTARASILRVAEVLISPSENSVFPGSTLNYSVVIRNRGNVNENYSLIATDNAGWGKLISPPSVAVPRGENRTATLTVTISDNATHCMRDNVTVSARSEDVVRGSGWCIAHSVTWEVRVSISPSFQENMPGGQLDYSVTVTNSGMFADNYDISVTDNAGWGFALSENLLENVLNGASGAVGLSVLIPDNAVGCTNDNIIVTAVSRTDNTVRASGGCVAHAIIVRKMMVLSITPSYQSGLPGSSLTYTVTIKNTGNASDTYNLTVSDNAGWSPTLSPTSLAVPPGENSTATLSVTIPSAAVQFTRDNVTVTAASAENAELRVSASCEAQASPMRGVEISISPGYGRGPQGSTLTYTVTIKNKGTVAENFALSATSVAGWSPSVEPASLTLAPGASGEATLKVVIPLTASKDTSVPVMVRATSTEDPTVSASGTCRAIVGAVAEKKEGIPIITLLVPLALIAIAIIVAILIAKYLPRRRRKVGRYKF